MRGNLNSQSPTDLEVHGSLNVPIFHITQPLGIWSFSWLLFLVMSNSPKMGHLPIPEVLLAKIECACP